MSYGIILDRASKETNIGGVFRSAHCFNASLLGLIGRKYSRQSSDTGDATKHIPTFKYETARDFINHLPMRWDLVAVEITPDATNLVNFAHPKQALYVFGPENGSVSKDILAIARYKVKIPSRFCLNLSIAASLLMYDRISKCSK